MEVIDRQGKVLDCGLSSFEKMPHPSGEQKVAAYHNPINIGEMFMKIHPPISKTLDGIRETEIVFQ